MSHGLVLHIAATRRRASVYGMLGSCDLAIAETLGDPRAFPRAHGLACSIAEADCPGERVGVRWCSLISLHGVLDARRLLPAVAREFR